MTKTAAPPVALVRGLSKAYGLVRAVDGVDFTVERGEAIAMLGPNGAGKSTTINMMLGLLTPDEGAVTVLGRTPEQAMRAGLLGDGNRDDPRAARRGPRHDA
jgi:ABC-2 type transport system ATP-binding protein